MRLAVLDQCSFSVKRDRAREAIQRERERESERERERERVKLSLFSYRKFPDFFRSWKEKELNLQVLFKAVVTLSL